MSALRRPLAAFALAWGAFLVATLCSRLPAVVEGPAWATHFVGKSVLALSAFVGMAIGGGPWHRWGFRAAASPRWGRAIFRGALLGAAATILLIVSPARGMPWLRELGLPGIVLWIWIHSSLTEELFVRGWFQGFVRPESAEPVRLGRWTLVPEAVWSGALFGSMHLMILAWGADWWTVGMIVPATTLLGLFAAEERALSGSLAPAVVTHVAFNVGGFLAGVVAAIAFFAATGEKPSF